MKKHQTPTDEIIIFTDGASKVNPGPGGWGGIIVHSNKVEEVGGRSEHTTNNQMELSAAIESLKKITNKNSNQAANIKIYTDSSYLINGITKWVFGWQKKNWITTTKEKVLNKELWQELIEVAKGKKIEWLYVGGHRGISGNERCDEIATAFADDIKPKLYKGDKDNYSLDILNLNLDETKSKKRNKDKTRSKAKAYSYLSLVKGKIMKHSTWADCERRVKGESGAKFKKALSANEEIEIAKSWGIKI